MAECFLRQFQILIVQSHHPKLRLQLDWTLGVEGLGDGAPHSFLAGRRRSGCGFDGALFEILEELLKGRAFAYALTNGAHGMETEGAVAFEL